jgi:hypothetical protein
VVVGESGWPKKTEKKSLKQFIGLLSILVQEASRVVVGESGWHKSKKKRARRRQAESKQKKSGQAHGKTSVAATSTPTCGGREYARWSSQNADYPPQKYPLAFNDVRHLQATRMLNSKASRFRGSTFEYRQQPKILCFRQAPRHVSHLLRRFVGISDHFRPLPTTSEADTLP